MIGWLTGARPGGNRVMLAPEELHRSTRQLGRRSMGFRLAWLRRSPLVQCRRSGLAMLLRADSQELIPALGADSGRSDRVTAGWAAVAELSHSSS